jgi:uncharacterized FlaG/YvyC family protein
MKTMIGIPGGLAPRPPADVEPREPQPAASNTTASPATPTPHQQDLDAALGRLEEQLRDLPGREREARLVHSDDDLSYVVEIRDKETGALLQTFPPEKLLNQGQRPADLLGTVIDRRS